MAASSIERLLSTAGEALLATEPRLSDEARRRAADLAFELEALLARRNGFYAFESALHFLPSGRASGVIDLDLWNSASLWRDAYGSLTDGCLFFAEDAFGGQFCIYEDAVFRFDPETADKKMFAKNLAQWSGRILADFSVETGYLLAHEWQLLHGQLAPGTRLFPKYPFVLGGAFCLENLRMFDSVAGMRFLGEIARQIHHQPDGAKINIKIVD